MRRSAVRSRSVAQSKNKLGLNPGKIWFVFIRRSGIITQPRNGGGISVNPLEVSHNGKTLQVIPTLYFKGGSKIVPNTEEMTELRKEVHQVISKYTSPEVDTADESKVKA